MLLTEYGADTIAGFHRVSYLLEMRVFLYLQRIITCQIQIVLLSVIVCLIAFEISGLKTLDALGRVVSNHTVIWLLLHSFFVFALHGYVSRSF